jgi:putative DNA primase/helicase
MLLQLTPTDSQDQADGLSPFSEESLALAFSARHANALRYCDEHGLWYVWNGCRWERDSKRRVFTLARAVCREAAAKVNCTSNPDISPR